MAEIKILKETKNPLFQREEIEFEIESETSPKTSEAQKMLAEKLSKAEDCIKIERIKGNFGSKRFIVTSKAYSSKEQLDKIEKKPKVKGENKDGK